VAVRSSATAEDMPDHSFAGQYSSFLNVTSLDECLEAVKQCWASVWTDWAYDYLVQNKIEHEQIKMAVIVQQQVEAEMAGVVFTANPVTGSPSHVVIESCVGLGEALVSGRTTPAQITFHKKHLAIMRRSDGEDAGLETTLARKLVRLAKRVEKGFGCPQDIEWVLKQGRFALVQTRPITTKPVSLPWEERQVYSNCNLAEVVPDVLTPLTWSVIDHMLRTLFKSVCQLAGADIRRAPLADRVAGRLYFNINTGMAIMYPFFRWIPEDLDVDGLMGGFQDQQNQFDIPDEDLPDMGFSWPRYILSWPRMIYNLLRCAPWRAQRIVKRLGPLTDQLTRLNIEQMNSQELLALFETSLRANERTWDLLFLVTQAIALPVFEKACDDWLGDPSLTRRLFGAQGGMSDAQAGLDLWSLSCLAQDKSELKAMILSDRPWGDMQTCLNRMDEGDVFIKAWQTFMQKHGHHCRGELELFNARWSERPEYVLSMVRSYIRTMEDVDPLARQDQMAKSRAALTRQCQQQLRHPLKRALFNWSLKHAQQISLNRENWKNEVVRQMAAWRRISLAWGAKMLEQGTLQNREDIFFLTTDELKQLGLDNEAFDAQQIVAQRRQEYEVNCSLTPPPVLKGQFDPEIHKPPEVDSTQTILRGLGASAGIVRGKARVILLADDQSFVQAGEILVAPFTDPAWTPYFVPAAGIVMDQGGILSHGSIIAREYGIPAVVNVQHGTQLIKTGQMIEVDADQGIVRIL
jgi:phosphohistidine swiveling domain-containing protein